MVMVDPKGLIGDIHSETFRRHLEYSQYLGLENSQARLVILTASAQDKQIIFESEFLLLLNYFKPRGYFIKKSRYGSDELESTGITPFILVAGEPFETFLCTLIASRRFKSRIPIQLQLHFDPEQFRLGNGLYGKIKYLFTLIAIMYCDSIRLVNGFQIRSIPKRIYKSKRITISPLPIVESATTGKVFTTHRPRNIGIFGRLHSERGIKEILNAIAKLPAGFLDKVVVAGAGQLAGDFIKGLNHLVGEQNVIYLGHLEPESQQEFWDKIGVLISFPQYEAYGIAIRESLCHGIPVIATRSIGSELLESECPNDWIRILADPLNTTELKSSLEIAFSLETSNAFMYQSRKSNVENQKKLVRSWLQASQN